MENNQKYCKHCGELIDKDCVVCPKCGKQVEDLTSAHDKNIIINNSASSSSSATVPEKTAKKLPWYLKWSWIFFLGLLTGGIYWIIGFILRVNWKSKN